MPRNAKMPKLDSVALERLAGVFRAFGDGTRLALLQQLRGGERSVNELVEAVGHSQGNVSKQLRVLFDAGLVSRDKRGNQVFYQVADPLVYEMCALVCDKLNRDAKASAAVAYQI